MTSEEQQSLPGGRPPYRLPVPVETQLAHSLTVRLEPVVIRSDARASEGDVVASAA